MRFAIAQYPTPVLNTADFPCCFGKETLPLDEQQLLRPVETVLFPHSAIVLLEQIPGTPIWRIQTQEYSGIGPLFIDERFIAPASALPPKRKCILPSAHRIIQRLKAQMGARYIWGGNWPAGIPQLMEWYAPCMQQDCLDSHILDTWQLKGVDCSGLLYFASKGFTPRNTGQLVDWGQAVLIAQSGIEEMLARLLPLDIIVWKGHVVIVLDEKTAIESLGGQGVIATALKPRLHAILQERKPVDSYTSNEPSFVIRRWHPNYVTLR